MAFFFIFFALTRQLILLINTQGPKHKIILHWRSDELEEIEKLLKIPIELKFKLQDIK